jgi:hypothetical protein
MGDQDFLAKTEDSTPTALAQVAEVVHGWENLLARIAKGKALLKDLEKQEEIFARQTIPSMMKMHGLTTVGLDNGLTLSVEDKLWVRVPEEEEKRAEAIKFLFSNGGATLVKEQLIIEEASEEVKQKIEEAGYDYVEKETVNTNSLTAWAKEVLGLKKGSVQRLDPNEFPKCMGLFQYQEAKLKK